MLKLERILIITLLFTINIRAQKESWGVSIKSMTQFNGVDRIHDIEYYDTSTLYAAGRYRDTTQIGNNTLFSATTRNLWLSKIQNGEVQWAQGLGTAIYTPFNNPKFHNIHIATDSMNHCLFVGGTMSGGKHLFGSDTITTFNDELILTKLDTSGNVIWTKASKLFGLVTYDASIYDIVVTPDSGLLVCGSFNGSRVWFTDTLLSTTTSPYNGFLTKIDQNGNLEWNLNLSTSSSSVFNRRVTTHSIAVNSNGTILLTGRFEGDSLRIGNTSTYLPNTLGVNFLTLINFNGNPIYTKSLGETTAGTLSSGHLNAFGNHIYGCFSFFGSIYIPELNKTYYSPQYTRSWIGFKMRKTGFIEKAYLLSEPLNQSITSSDIAVNEDESRVYMLSRILVPTPSPNGIVYYTGLNLTSFDSSGSVLCNYHLNAASPIHITNITSNLAGEIAIGDQTWALPFNIGPLTTNAYQNFVLGLPDDFCGKESISSYNVPVCLGDSVLKVAPAGYSSYLWSNGVQNDSAYLSGNDRFYCTLTDNQGNLYLTPGFYLNYRISALQNSILATDSVLCTSMDTISIAADSSWTNVIWNNGLSTGSKLKVDTAGIYYYSAIDPQIPTCTFYSDTIEITYSSIDTLKIIGLPSVACLGDSFTLNVVSSVFIDSISIMITLNNQKLNLSGNTYIGLDTVGTYVFEVTARNMDSCVISSFDSVIVLSPSPTITVIFDTLISNYPKGNQWFLNGTLLTGDTLDYLVVSKNGLYELQVTDSIGCTNKASYNFNSINVSSTEFISKNLSVFPNPVSDWLQVSITGAEPQGMLVVYDVVGNRVFDHEIASPSLVLNLANLPPGLYVLTFKGDWVKFEKL